MLFYRQFLKNYKVLLLLPSSVDLITAPDGLKFEQHILVAEVTSLPSQDKEYYRLDLAGIYQARNLVPCWRPFMCWSEGDGSWNMRKYIRRYST